MKSISDYLCPAFTVELPDDLAGPARRLAKVINRLVDRNRSTGLPIRMLFKGEPGTGKSTLAKYLVRRLNVDPFSLIKLNGTDVTKDRVLDLAQTVAYRSLGWRCIWIEEADKIPMIAQVRFLTFADDLPSFTALVLTSNSHLEDIEERFHTRGYCVDVRGPSAKELFEFLRQFHSDPDVIQGVVECACSGNGQGNVRQALYDLDLALLAAAA